MIHNSVKNPIPIDQVTVSGGIKEQRSAYNESFNAQFDGCMSHHIGNSSGNL